MKFSAETKQLAEALSGASRLIERRSAIPILSNVLIDASPAG